MGKHSTDRFVRLTHPYRKNQQTTKQTSSDVLISYSKNPNKVPRKWVIPLSELSSKDVEILSMWQSEGIDKWDPFIFTEPLILNEQYPDSDDSYEMEEHLPYKSNPPIFHQTEQDNVKASIDLAKRLDILSCHCSENYERFRKELVDEKQFDPAMLYVLKGQRTMFPNDE